MAVGLDQLAQDLADESEVLRKILVGLDADGWELPTPAEGWAVRDQISHLAYFDDAALQSATDPDAFQAELEKLNASGGVSTEAVAEAHRELPGSALLAWFDTSRARLISVFAGLDGSKRVPWYGPPMSVTSSLTARLMETWAHGQDVADAVGVQREPTARLRHVAHIGVRTLGFSYALRGRTAPDDAVRVELAAPDSDDVWTWGDADAVNRVTGPALDFCLVVTQRRHRDDTALSATGPVADEWLSIAQAFAGAPGPGRPPKG
jgi:uncharacterized protein (TIGR03084 family)